MRGKDGLLVVPVNQRYWSAKGFGAAEAKSVPHGWVLSSEESSADEDPRVAARLDEE